MKKKYLFLLFAVACLTGKGYAQGQAKQPCGSTEARQQLLLTHPEILKSEADFDAQVKAGLKNIDLSKMAAHRTTADASELDSATFWYDIPIVIHIIHDYNPTGISYGTGDYIQDSVIFDTLKNMWNPVYAGHHDNDSAYVAHYTPNFIPYIGNPRIRLHLATIDPNGNPTKGITRHRSYLTYEGGEQAKLDDWDPTSYVNIWTVNTMSAANGMAAAYAHFATDVASIPFYDGVIALAGYLGVPHTINHEMGHMMNLYHPWGNTNNPQVACGDDDVDDTPPTKGHAEGGCQPGLISSEPTSMYDTACAENYFKIYTDIHGNDSLVNYPDTTNTLNIMDYTYCAKMFTKGQVTRMHTTLNSDVAGRNNLWSGANLVRTGVKINATDSTFAPMPDLPPIVEYAVYNAHSSVMQYFTCAKLGSLPAGLTFKDESWNDTIVSRKWTLGNGATTSTSTGSNVSTNFSTPGWANVTLADSGNHTATTTNSSTPIFVAQATGMAASGYYEEFKGATAAQWPTFNYYNNEFKWQPAGVGFYDDSSMMYTGFDSRLNPSFGIYPTTGEPIGDFDDMFSIPVDLSGFSGACSLNYMYSGASRSANSLDINDALEIDYSTDRSNTWTTLTTLTKSQISNKGEYAFAYAPVSQADWAPMSINIPAAARTNYTVFRFRYKPGIAVGYDGTTVTGSYSSGNNFYMDRVNFSPWPAGVSNVVAGTADVVVAPNPTNGDAYVIIKDMDNVTARIVVTDITGKVVYTTNELISGNEAHVLIPHNAISVQGMYIVQTITGTQVTTKKLVVE